MTANSRVDDDEFLDMIASIQGSRMDDQRADAVALFPGLHNSPALMRQMAAAAAGAHATLPSISTQATILDDDQFFETLMRCQVCVNVHYRDVLERCEFGVKTTRKCINYPPFLCTQNENMTKSLEMSSNRPHFNLHSNFAGTVA